MSSLATRLLDRQLASSLRQLLIPSYTATLIVIMLFIIAALTQLITSIAAEIVTTAPIIVTFAASLLDADTVTATTALIKKTSRITALVVAPIIITTTSASALTFTNLVIAVEVSQITRADIRIKIVVASNNILLRTNAFDCVIKSYQPSWRSCFLSLVPSALHLFPLLTYLVVIICNVINIYIRFRFVLITLLFLLSWQSVCVWVTACTNTNILAHVDNIDEH